MNKHLSKSSLLHHQQCPLRLWLEVYQPELLEVDTQSASRIETGQRVGEIARSLYPQGVLVDTLNSAQAIEQTGQLLATKPAAIFEAAFAAQDVLVRADILIPDRNEWRVVEVKSAAHVKDYYVPDAAIQSWVAKQSGITLSRIDIAHIDTSFVYSGNNQYEGLLKHVDISEAVTEKEPDVRFWIKAAQKTLSGKRPKIDPGEQCNTPFPCPFINHCIPESDEDSYPPEILPNNRGLAAQLRNEGYNDLRDVPLEHLSKPIHRRMWECIKHNRVFLDNIAGEIIERTPCPRYYVDFESIQPAIPLWIGIHPYAQIPFQWSCHIEADSGDIQHRSFLADGSGDPRRAFADSLVNTLGTTGAIFVYNATFERSRMQELANDFPDLAPALHAAIHRIVDLLPIARKHYYHPQMHGSWSIKAVLPTIAPELSYDDLEVSDGNMAQQAYTEIMSPQTSSERRQQLREALLLYCERDTYAMVKIAHYFMNGK